MRRNAVTAVVLAAAMTGACRNDDGRLRISWKDNVLTLHSDRLPGGRVRVLYLEAFCRRGSTDRAWNETTLPFQTKLLEADAAGSWLNLETLVDGKVTVHHEIQAGTDEVDFRLVLTNNSDQAVDVEWAQPCLQVGEFTGRGQQDYFEKCFVFTQSGLTRMHETHRETKARYTPGQVYVPAGIDLNDVNPRPISRTRPINGLVGCFSADEKLVLAMAWDQVQELFQGVIVCIHSDFHIGGLRPGQTKRRHGKIYLMRNDIDRLLLRYHRDFGLKH